MGGGGEWRGGGISWKARGVHAGRTLHRMHLRGGGYSFEKSEPSEGFKEAFEREIEKLLAPLDLKSGRVC